MSRISDAKQLEIKRYFIMRVLAIDTAQSVVEVVDRFGRESAGAFKTKLEYAEVLAHEFANHVYSISLLSPGEATGIDEIVDWGLEIMRRSKGKLPREVLRGRKFVRETSPLL